MKKIIAIAKNELHLLFRRKVGYAVIILCSAISIFMFFFARSDGLLLNELKIRIRYSFYFSTGLLNLILMYLACVSLRKEIDTRKFHTMAAAPVHRFQIWLGKFFGLWTFGAIAFSALSLFIGCCCIFYIQTWPDADQRMSLASSFFRVYRVVSPQSPSLKSLVEREYKRKEINNLLPVGKPAWDIKQEIYDEIRRKKQMLKPESSKSWNFNWPGTSPAGKFATLKFKFYTEDKNRIIEGNWKLSSPDSTGGWNGSFRGYAYQFHKLKIPLIQVPHSRRLILTFTGKHTPYLIFPRKNGVAILYDDGNIFKNFTFMMICILLHFASLIALSLTLCSFFSYSVAVFMNMVIYGIGSSSGFFMNVVRDLSQPAASGTSPGMMKIFLIFIHTGLTISKGVKAPPVIEYFSDGLIVPMIELAENWGPSLVIYTGLMMVLGIIVLTRKEIDKELHN